MSRSGAEALRVALVGASAEAGVRLREALAESGVPGSRVDLYGAAAGELKLSEYDGEARMIQEPDVAEIAGHALVFVCGEQDAILASLVSAMPPDATVIDLAGALPAGLRSSRLRLDADLDLGPGVEAQGRGWYAVAHPLALLLAQMLRPLEQAFGVVEAAAVVLRPASDFGQAGVEELREQTLGLLNFAECPAETFGRQLAFNLIPQSALVPAQPQIEPRVIREVAELLDWPQPRLALKLIAAPLFYGHGVQLRFRLREAPTLDAVCAALRESDLMGPAEAQASTTPLDVAGEVRTSLSDVAEDGLGGFWVWGVAGEAGAWSARQAVRLASMLGRL